MYKKRGKIKTNRDDLIQCGYSIWKLKLVRLPQWKYKMANNWSLGFLCYPTVHSYVGLLPWLLAQRLVQLIFCRANARSWCKFYAYFRLKIVS